jgi:hypothetical protein
MLGVQKGKNTGWVCVEGVSKSEQRRISSFCAMVNNKDQMIEGVEKEEKRTRNAMQGNKKIKENCPSTPFFLFFFLLGISLLSQSFAIFSCLMQ